MWQCCNQQFVVHIVPTANQKGCTVTADVEGGDCPRFESICPLFCICFSLCFECRVCVCGDDTLCGLQCVVVVNVHFDCTVYPLFVVLTNGHFVSCLCAELKPKGLQSVSRFILNVDCVPFSISLLCVCRLCYAGPINHL